MDTKQWLAETARRPVYDQDIANILGVTRKTANKRINEGLEASDLIVICRGLSINPVIALVELGYITDDEVADYLDSDGQLVATAEDGDLALELARRLNPATRAPLINAIAARSNVVQLSSAQPDKYDGIVREWDESTPHAADSSPDETEERLNRGEDPID